jgi:hypothetical protein
MPDLDAIERGIAVIAATLKRLLDRPVESPEEHVTASSIV